jgi:hypothetical protein
MNENEPEDKPLCQCQDWQENIPYLHDLVLLRWLHGGQGYRGKPFVYCPWCGSKLTIEKSEQEDRS